MDRVEDEWSSSRGLKEFLDSHTVRHYSKYTTRPRYGLRAWRAGFWHAAFFWACPAYWGRGLVWTAACGAAFAHLAAVTAWFGAYWCDGVSRLAERLTAEKKKGPPSCWAAAWHRDESSAAVLPVALHLLLAVAYGFVVSAAETRDRDDDLELTDDEAPTWETAGLGPVRVTVFATETATKHAMTLAELRAVLLSAASAVEDSEASAGRAFAAAAATVFALVRVSHETATRRRPPNLLVATSAACSWLFAYVALERLNRADRCYRTRLRYAKLYAATTSSRRARSRGVPYLKLRKVEHLKVWLALRAGRGYLKALGRERDADAVCSAAFHACAGLTVAVLALYFKDDDAAPAFPHLAFHFELLVAWALSSSYVVAFVGLGSKVNARYSDATALHVEMINIHLVLQHLNADATMVSPSGMGRRAPPTATNDDGDDDDDNDDDDDADADAAAAKKRQLSNGGLFSSSGAMSPLKSSSSNIHLLHAATSGDDPDDGDSVAAAAAVDRKLAVAAKKARLQSSLAVIKTAAKLLKDVDSPSKVSGFAMDPIFYNVVRCVFYSAISAMLSDWLGLDLKFKPSYFK